MNEHSMTVRLWDPDGADLARMDMNFLPTRNPAHPERSVGWALAIQFQRLEFPRAGDYGFHILLDKQEKRVLPLYIEVPSQPLS